MTRRWWLYPHHTVWSVPCDFSSPSLFWRAICCGVFIFESLLYSLIESRRSGLLLYSVGCLARSSFLPPSLLPFPCYPLPRTFSFYCSDACSTLACVSLVQKRFCPCKVHDTRVWRFTVVCFPSGCYISSVDLFAFVSCSCVLFVSAIKKDKRAYGVAFMYSIQCPQRGNYLMWPFNVPTAQF